MTADGLVSVGHASFLGLPDQGPSLLVNGRPVPRLDAQRIDTLCGLILARRPLAEWPAELFAVQSNIRKRGPLLSDPLQPGDAIRSSARPGRRQGRRCTVRAR
jgi:[NiFe] hydrogenase diaphorase moiety large subunit